MTDLEITAWDAMLDALHLCKPHLPANDRVALAVTQAIAAAEQARDMADV